MAAPRRVTIDQEADAGYLTLTDARVERTLDHGSFVVDYSADGRPVGVEVLTLGRPLDTAALLEVLEESGAADADTRAWVKAFAAQILGLDDRVPAPVPSLRLGPKAPREEVLLLTVAEVASIMRVSKMTVYRMVHSGVLPAVRVGRSYRVPERSVHEYVDETDSRLRVLK
jgi:excisionase family DNA binding protein